MAGYINSFNQKAIAIGKPICNFLHAQLQQTSNWYSEKCHEAGQWVGRQVDNELAAQVAETALKAAPITAFCFTLYATMTTPVILGLGICTTAIVLTNPDMLSKEGKEAILTGLAGAVLLNTAYHVMAALAMIHMEALVFSVVVGGAEFLACYSCLKVVQQEDQPPPGAEGEAAVPVAQPSELPDGAEIVQAGKEALSLVGREALSAAARAGTKVFTLYNAAEGQGKQAK